MRTMTSPPHTTFQASWYSHPFLERVSLGSQSNSRRAEMSSTKSILITGCSDGGIGAAIALVLAKQGHHVFATARDTAKIPEALRNLSNVTVLSLDVGDTASVAAAAQIVVDRGCGLHVLVNNAGIECLRPVLDIDIAVAQRLHDINLWGPLRMVQAFADLLIASRGRIVNISSSASVINSPWICTFGFLIVPLEAWISSYPTQLNLTFTLLHSFDVAFWQQCCGLANSNGFANLIAAYAASKAALNTLSETMRLELAPLGVSVVTILPGVIDSKLHVNGTASFDLPPTSRYAAIKDIIAGWANGTAQPKDSLSVDKFAELVVDDIMGTGKGGVVSRGPYAALLRCIGQWAPRWLAVNLPSLQPIPGNRLLPIAVNKQDLSLTFP